MVCCSCDPIQEGDLGSNSFGFAKKFAERILCVRLNTVRVLRADFV
jgi:hypothetical protein